jgi:hypothetical protein
MISERNDASKSALPPGGVMKRWFALMALVLGTGIPHVFAADLPRTASPAGAKVYIISPKDGATVHNPVTVQFGLSGMGVAPAGTAAENTGHHHLIVDAPLPAMDQPLPKDDTHLHFGKGQTETVLTLAPGKHTLQLVLGDSNHIPHDPPVVSEKVTIHVK